MKYLQSKLPIAIALPVLALGFSLEHPAAAKGGVLFRGGLLVILASIISIVFRISHFALFAAFIALVIMGLI